jgi:hypothetical protein
MNPKPARIAFGGGGVNPIFDVQGKDLACNVRPTPPGAIAEVRAGSTITFHWSRWLYSHKGPITAWLAPYVCLRLNLLLLLSVFSPTPKAVYP